VGHNKKTDPSSSGVQLTDWAASPPTSFNGAPGPNHPKPLVRSPLRSFLALRRRRALTSGLSLVGTVPVFVSVNCSPSVGFRGTPLRLRRGEREQPRKAPPPSSGLLGVGGVVSWGAGGNEEGRTIVVSSVGGALSGGLCRRRGRNGLGLGGGGKRTCGAGWKLFRFAGRVKSAQGTGVRGDGRAAQFGQGFR